MWKKEFRNRFLPLGRIGRIDYIRSFLFITFTAFLVFSLTSSVSNGYIWLFMICYIFFLMWCVFCLAAKRMHDIGYSAWIFALLFLGLYIFSNLGAFINGSIGRSLFVFHLEQKMSYFLFVLLSFIYLFLMLGNTGENKYGKDPYSD